MLDRIVIEKVGAGLGLAFALALGVKMLLPHARRVQVDLWLHTQRLRLRRRLKPFWLPTRAVAASAPVEDRAAEVTATLAPPRITALGARRAVGATRSARPLPPRSLRRHRDGEWTGNVFHLRPMPPSQKHH